MPVIAPRSAPASPVDGGALKSSPDIEDMFDRIARHYDVMNRLMTVGRDSAWRRLVARQAVLGGRTGSVLDVATGTGDLAIDLARAGAASVTAVDLSENMLDIARRKADAAGDDVSAVIDFRRIDAMKLPYDDDTFDACAIAFGLRNMPNYGAALREMVRVLRPGGRWICLELTPFRVPVLRSGFGLYFEWVVPIVGGLVSGERDAYRYLPQSVQHFPTAAGLAAQMELAGLVNTRYRLLAGGTVAIHAGEKTWPNA